MFEAILEALPADWRPALEIVLGLVTWIPAWQAELVDLVWWGRGSAVTTIASRVFVFFPALLLVVALWSTMVSVYTLPFRSRRGPYLQTLAMTWWDAGRGVWLFWAGFARLVLVLAGWTWGTIRYAFMLLLRAGREMIATPFAALDWTSRSYFKPGVPWIAFLLIVGWSALEATVFTFTLRPTMTGILYDLTGAPPNPAVLTPILFMMLFMLIAGSFACVQVLTDAIEQRKVKEIVQMVLVELIVMFFEVIFLYRELISAVTPWIAQQTGGQVLLGLWSTLALASFGWIGIRAMTWFLFGRFGTPALLAILSRETLTVQGAAAPAAAARMPASNWSKELMQSFKAEREWFNRKGEELMELAVLPVLQLFAVAINFFLVLLTSHPAFTLPFRNLSEAMEKLPLAGGASRPKAGKQPAGAAGEA